MGPRIQRSDRAVLGCKERFFVRVGVPSEHERRSSVTYREQVESELGHPTGTLALRLRFSLMTPMNSDRIFEAAIRASKNLLWQNLQSTNDLPDAATVIRLRELVYSPSIRSAILHSSDTLLAFALRAVEHAVADQSQTDREN